MSLSHFTKQIAQQTVGGALDALKPGDTAAPPSDNLAALIAGELQAMQGACKEDQELVVSCSAGGETIRLLEVFTPSPKLLVLTGWDANRVITRLIAPADSIQLVCKPMTVKAEGKPIRIRFAAPKPKNE